MPIPYPKSRADLQYFKQICVYAFTAESIRKFKKLGQSQLERTEGIEFLRYIENHIPIKLVEVEGDTIAVDTPDDLELVIDIMSKSK